ncbi:uncharacterized protein THITE_2122340 [Thermothielavioides terrestris NRRL 8126]|uniref:MARVEL domain-containing protein n=1 Tax=Thermothielavioides terrestris (strain ATCC 38088 / NRRL 8126) TaxID=578455 RepID=G2RCS5_THETT|nr:uncharacterized protein THITE_2122340 [Thermothielavioides terrestris NRRL 8126]AEO70671.1 hypothetical protein THITE_2122340 [Thermothielavioides terrestris NRRL 8126]
MNAVTLEAPGSLPGIADTQALPRKDLEKRRCVPRIRAVGALGIKFNWAQVVCRFVAVAYELGTLGFIAWLYSYWRSEPTTRVDVLFPSFFPVIVGILMDGYEVVSLLFLNRREAVNPVAVCFDVAMIGVGIFCFLILGSVEPGAGERHASWVTDMNNAMIFMVVFCAIHAGFIVMAAGGVISIYCSASRRRRDAQLAKSQAEIVQFNERRQQLSQPLIS